jgi:hypothetical protein
MRTVIASFQAMDAAAACWAWSALEPPVANADIHRETLRARGRLSRRETPRDKDEVLETAPPCGSAPSGALVDGCNQASLHNCRQMGEQNGSVGNAPLKPAPIVTPPPKTRSRYGIAHQFAVRGYSLRA